MMGISHLSVPLKILEEDIMILISLLWEVSHICLSPPIALSYVTLILILVCLVRVNKWKYAIMKIIAGSLIGLK